MELEGILGRVSALRQLGVSAGRETLNQWFENGNHGLTEALGESFCELWSWSLGSKIAWSEFAGLRSSLNPVQTDLL